MFLELRRKKVGFQLTDLTSTSIRGRNANITTQPGKTKSKHKESLYSVLGFCCIKKTFSSQVCQFLKLTFLDFKRSFLGKSIFSLMQHWGSEKDEGTSGSAKQLGVKSAMWLPKKHSLGLPWWRGGWESACQCRGHGFEPWSGKIPHATEQLSPWATTTEPAHLEPVLRNRRGRDS